MPIAIVIITTANPLNNWPFINPMDVNKPTPPGINNKVRLSNKNPDTFSMLPNFIKPVSKAKSKTIIPKTGAGIGNLVTSIIICEKNNMPSIINELKVSR